MEAIRIGQLTIRTDDDQIEFIVDGAPMRRATVSAKDLPGIVDFLRGSALAGSERRTGFRVPIASLGSSIGERLRAFVTTQRGDWVEVTPVNISLTGILVETEENLGAQGTQSSVKLALDDNTVQLPSVVVRHEPNRVAFQFTESIKDGELEPPPKLVAIYRTLETLWLKARVN